MLIDMIQDALEHPVDSFEEIGAVIFVAFLIIFALIVVLLIILKIGNQNEKKCITVLGPGHNVEFVRDDEACSDYSWRDKISTSV